MKLSDSIKTKTKIVILASSLYFTAPIYYTFAQAPTIQISEDKDFENKLWESLHKELEDICHKVSKILISPIKAEDIENNKVLLRSYKKKLKWLGITNPFKIEFIKSFIAFREKEFAKTLTENQKNIYLENKKTLKINI